MHLHATPFACFVVNSSVTDLEIACVFFSKYFLNPNIYYRADDRDIDESKYLTNSNKDKLKRISNEIEKEIKNVDMMKIDDNLYMEIRKSQEALEELEMIILRLND